MSDVVVVITADLLVSRQHPWSLMVGGGLVMALFDVACGWHAALYRSVRWRLTGRESGVDPFDRPFWVSLTCRSLGSVIVDSWYAYRSQPNR